MKVLSGKLLALRPSTVGEVLSLRVQLLHCSISWLPDQTKFGRCVKLFTGKIFLMWPTCWLLSWYSLLLSTSKVSVLFCLWGQRTPVVNKARIPSSCFTLLTCQLFFSQHLCPTFISFLRYPSHIIFVIHVLNALMKIVYIVNDSICAVASQEI